MKDIFYQLEFDKCLNATELFLYEETNEILSGVSIWLRFDPVFYGLNEANYDREIEIDGKMKSLCGLVEVGFDNKTKEFSFLAHDFINLKYTIVGFTKDVVETVESDISKELSEIIGFKAPMSEAVMIESKEFYFIIEKYGHLFEKDNRLQSCAYNYHEINFFEKYSELKINHSYFAYNDDSEQVVVGNYQKDNNEGVCWEVHDNSGIGWIDKLDLAPINKTEIKLPV